MTRVRFTFTDHKSQIGTVEGEVTDTALPFGRIEVRDDEGNLHHVQPTVVTEVPSMTIAPHPDYGQGVWTTEAVKAEALGLDANQPTEALVASIMEILDRHGYDSMDRELAFWHYSQVTGREYNDFYDAWLAS